MPDQSRGRFDCSLREALGREKIVVSDQALIVSVAEMIQDLAERASCDSEELRELFVLEAAHVSFGDVPWCRSHRIAQLIDELVLSLEFRLR